ncbi:MAG: DUF4249 family protein [Bacteroidota bacterium]
MKYIRFLLFPLLTIFLFSCIEEVEWETEDYKELLVVDGSFTDEYKRHKITLTKTSDYFSGEKTPAVKGADVSISGGPETISFVESSEEPGVYITKDSVAGFPGNTYTLDIYLNEPLNNEIHYTAKEEMKTGVDLDSVQAILKENPAYTEDNPGMDSMMIDVRMFWMKSPVEDNYYRVQLYLKDSLENNTIDNFYIYEGGEEIEGGSVSNFYFFKNFQPKDTVVIENCSVTDQYYEYIDGLKNITNQEDDQFFDMSGPPANAVGNIEGAEAMGYFRVSSVSKAATVVIDGRND